MLKGKKIRTILSSSVGGSLGSLTSDALVSNLNYLRTLDLSNLNLRMVPHSIGELKHLRYLDLSKNKAIKILPNSITKLLNLQTLKLSGCESLRELPRGIKKLFNLRHLDISGCRRLTHMPLGLRHLTSLEILPKFVVSQEGFNARSSCGWCKNKKATSSGGPSELKELRNLGGRLRIENLGHGKDDMVECKATNMKEKQHLQRLELAWDQMSDREFQIVNDEESLEGLQPHPNLKALELLRYMGVRIPSWVSSLTNLVELRFVINRKLKYLPPLNKLPFLKSLYMKEMEALEYISEEEDSVSNVFGGRYSSSSSKTIEFFPSLFSLVIWKCPNLKGWWRKDYDNEPDHLLLPSFPCLSKLDIVNCPKLTSMPLFPYLKESLILWETSSKVLQQTMKMGTRQRATTSTSSSSWFPLSQLQYLRLWDVNDLESLPEEWLGNLTSIQRLQIRGCPNLTSLPQGIRNLTSLQHLTIINCPHLWERCQRQIGEDWPNIAHVPYVNVDGVNQQ
jgi:Leucine-rich repeat (LRR) protein